MPDDILSGVGDYADPTGDPLDVITLAEAKAALNIPTANTTLDAEIATYITAISGRLDDLCGPIVIRTVTEQHDEPGDRIFLSQYPVDTVTTVTEYTGGTATVLTAENLETNSADNYLLDAPIGVIRRRSGWSTVCFASTAVVVEYEAGRYADTASVARKFKQAAEIMLSHLWRGEQGAGTVTFAEAQVDSTLTPTFAVPNAVLQLLEAELKAPALR